MRSAGPRSLPSTTVLTAGGGDDGGGGGGGTATTGTTQPSPAPGQRLHVGEDFSVEVPATWQTTFEDRLINVDPESRATRWEMPFEAVLAVTTSDPMVGTVRENCTNVFDDRAMATLIEGPTATPVGARDTCSFAYIRPDGQVRVEYLFAISTREFLVTAGAAPKQRPEPLPATPWRRSARPERWRPRLVGGHGRRDDRCRPSHATLAGRRERRGAVW